MREVDAGSVAELLREPTYFLAIKSNPSAVDQIPPLHSLPLLTFSTSLTQIHVVLQKLGEGFKKEIMSQCLY